MTKKILFHGSTADNIKYIMRDGFKSDNKIWDCSEDDMTYFYSLDKMAEVEGLNLEDEDEYQEAWDMCIRRAIENAQVTGACQKYSGTELKVIVLEIDEEYIEPDYSCDYSGCHMGDLGAVQVYNEDLNNFGEITDVMISNNYYPSIMGAYIQQFLNRDEVTLNLNKWDYKEVEMLKRVDFSSIWDSLLDEIDWY